MKKFLSYALIIVVLANLVIYKSTITTEAVSVMGDLSDEKKVELEVFLGQFVATGFMTSDYNRVNANADNSTFALLFALVQASIDNPNWYESENWVYDEGTQVPYGLLASEDEINKLLLRYFDIDEFWHRSIRHMYYNYLFRDGYYYKLVANGGPNFFGDNLVKFVDNENGTFSARLEIQSNGMYGAPRGLSYFDAVIQPHNDNGIRTYQLLYWKNLVSLEDPLPVREPTPSRIEFAYDVYMRHLSSGDIASAFIAAFNKNAQSLSLHYSLPKIFSEILAIGGVVIDDHSMVTADNAAIISEILGIIQDGKHLLELILLYLSAYEMQNYVVILREDYINNTQIINKIDNILYYISCLKWEIETAVDLLGFNMGVKIGLSTWPAVGPTAIFIQSLDWRPMPYEVKINIATSSYNSINSQIKNRVYLSY